MPFDVLPPGNTDPNEPWNNSTQTREQCVHDLIAYLRCYATIGTNDLPCEAILHNLVNSGRFLRQAHVSQEMKELFGTALDVLVNNAEEHTMTGDQIDTLYKTIVPSNTRLPFCVRHEGKDYAWFVPVDGNGTQWKSCLLVDPTLSATIRAEQGLYSTSRIPFISSASRLHVNMPPNPYEAVDMLVWLLVEILNKGRWLEVDGGSHRILRPDDYNYLLNSLRQIVDHASKSYGLARRIPSFPGSLP